MPFTDEFPDGFIIRAFFLMEWDFENNRPAGLREAVRSLSIEVYGANSPQVQEELDMFDDRVIAKFIRAMNIARLAGMLEEGY